MQFKCKIDMDNAAFAHEPHLELANIIKQISKDVDAFVYVERTKTIRDYNGNKVGEWTIGEDNA